MVARQKLRATASAHQATLIEVGTGLALGYAEKTGTMQSVRSVTRVDPVIVLGLLSFLPGKSRMARVAQEVGSASATIASYKFGLGTPMVGGDDSAPSSGGDDWQDV